MEDNSSNNQVILKGSHGTLSSNALDIKINGFNPSGTGRHSFGVYFWKECPYWYELAVAWCKQKNKDWSYYGKNKGKVLYCNITTFENNFFNIEQEEIKNGILKTVKEKKLDHNDSKQISKIWDMVINAMEKKRGTLIEVVEGTVNPPQIEFFPDKDGYPIQYAGWPICLTVRNKACIKVYDDIEFEI